MSLIAKLIVKHLVAKAAKSTTAAVAAGVAVGGTALVFKPEYLDLVPEQYRGYVLLAIAALTALARFRGELQELVAELRAQK